MEVGAVAPRAVVDALPDRGEAALEGGPALVRVLVEARLARIELVLAPVGDVGHVRHHHVRAGEDALLAAVRRERLERGRGGDVDVVQVEARRRDHVEADAQAVRVGPGIRDGRERRVRMRDVGPHADHVHVPVAEEDDVPREVLRRLSRKRAHHARADLVAAAAQGREAVRAARPAVVRGMEACVESGGRRLDAQQVAGRARGLPAPVDRLRLLAEGQRHAQVQVRHAAQALLDEGRVRLALDLAALQHDRGVARRGVDLRHPQHVVDGKAVAREVRVRAADAAVEAVLRADVPELDEAAHRDELPGDAALERIGRGARDALLVRVLERDQPRQVVHGEVPRTLPRAGDDIGDGRHRAAVRCGCPSS